jgi:hypothetical protein
VRLHKVFTFHLGVAVGLAWMTALYAALYAPWVRNIRPLIDPTNLGRVESTWSFLFGMPAVLTVAWWWRSSGRDMLQQFRMLKNQTVELPSRAPRRSRSSISPSTAPSRRSCSAAERPIFLPTSCVSKVRIPRTGEDHDARQGLRADRPVQRPARDRHLRLRGRRLIPNSRLPLIVRRGAVSPAADDPARAFEKVFSQNGWTTAGAPTTSSTTTTTIRPRTRCSASRPVPPMCASAAKAARPSGSRPATWW